MESIQDMNALQALVRDNPHRDWRAYGQVNARLHESGALIQFDYTSACSFKKPAEWNWFERVSRGLILAVHSGEVVARPFDKFWNWGEVEPAPDAVLVEVAEKLDGSLGILYRHQGRYQIATRGSFDSDQARWANRYLERHCDLSKLPWNYTLLFEIIYPQNRVVVDYGERRDLVLIGVRDRFTGYDLPRASVREVGRLWHFALPAAHQTGDLMDVLADTQRLTANEEGYVLRFSDGTRLKVKGDEYRKYHRWIMAFSFKNVLEAVQTDCLEALREACPPHYAAALADYERLIDERLGDVARRSMVAHHACVRVARPYSDDDRAYKKAYAQAAMTSYPDLSRYLFALRDGKDLRALIFKHGFEAELRREAVAEEA